MIHVRFCLYLMHFLKHIGNADHFCQFGSGSPSGVVIAGSPSINESGYDSMSGSFYHSPTSPQEQPLTPLLHQPTMHQSPMRPMPQQLQHSSSPMNYHQQNYQHGYQVPCTPPGNTFVLIQFYPQKRKINISITHALKIW